MVQTNGYFTIEFKDNNEAICHVFPAKEKGAPVEYRELANYLDAHGFSYDVKEVNRVVTSKEGADLSLKALSTLEYADTMDLDIDRDKSKAICRFYPGSKNGGKLNAKDIMAALSVKQISFGIDQQAIMDYLQNPVYCTDILIAKGTPVTEGKDAYIEYMFNTNPNSKPAYNEDGSVDFHNLDVISHVQKGQLLAKLHPEDKGKPGRDICGHEVSPKPVKPAFLAVGRNISLSEDRTEAISDVTGHVKLYNGQIFVSDVYEVPADVDNSTGDIEYNGNVLVKGSIRDGFQVNAKGDVIVEGVVEGALVMSGGQIVIKRGVNGMNKGVLQARGNIICKFIENAKVFSDGYVETGAIIHSDVSAKGDIVVANKKGFITGGVIRAGGRVEAMTIGSNMGAATRIEIGMDPDKKERFNLLQKEVTRINAENAKLIPVIKNYKAQVEKGIELDPKNKEYYIKLKQMLIKNKQDLESNMEEFEDLKKLMENSQNAKVVVSKDIYPGVTVVCSDASYTLKDKRSFCYLERKDGEIVIMNL